MYYAFASFSFPNVILVLNREPGKKYHTGGLYALSSDLVRYVGASSWAKAHVKGREDQVTSLWLQQPDIKDKVVWVDEQCLIYDHPKAGTVHSKGFLFPLEIERLRSLFKTSNWGKGGERGSTVATISDRFSYDFAGRWIPLYATPIDEARLSVGMKLMALVEGSAMSMLQDGDDEKQVLDAWKKDVNEIGIRGRWLLDGGNSTLKSGGNATKKKPPLLVGGSIVVHYVKTTQHWRECVDILLDGWRMEQKAKEQIKGWRLEV